MNFKKLAKYILLLWLPLATLELHNQNKPNALLRNENYSKSMGIDFKSKLKMLMGNTKKKVKENLEKTGVADFSFKKNKLRNGRASKNFLKRISANSILKEQVVPFNPGGKIKRAHSLNYSLESEVSALNVHIKSKNTSAAIYRKNAKRLWKKYFKSQVQKREVTLNISEEKSVKSLNDYEDEDIEGAEEGNSTEMGSYLGAPCELTCSEKLLHVFCDPTHRVCECEEEYPVQIGVGRGCEKPKQLGDQCFYAQTCSFFDPNAVCTQISHNAICQCKPGYHSVALRKGVKRLFCSEDIAVVSADLPTLLGVATGIAVLTGLICFVLRLFSGNRYPTTRHYGNANIAPPLLLSSDNQWVNGIPLTVHDRPSSRSSCQRSTMSLAQYPRNKGVLVPASRAGAARAAAILLIPCHLQASRPSDSEVIKNSKNDDNSNEPNEVEQSFHLGSRRHSFSSVHSTSSSQRSTSYSARRFEQENQQREQRMAIKAAREEATRVGALPSPKSASVDSLVPATQNTEEDPLCSNTSESPLQSEPPAFSVRKNLAAIPSSDNSTS